MLVGGMLLIIAGEEHKLAGSDANPVSMLNGRAAYLSPVDERPVVTLEVGNLINARGCWANGAMLSRDAGVADHDLIGSVPSQRQGIVS